MVIPFFVLRIKKFQAVVAFGNYNLHKVPSKLAHQLKKENTKV